MSTALAKGQFLTPLVLEQIPARGWWDWPERHLVKEPLVYRDRAGRVWTVPVGFDTDLASIPRHILFFVVIIGVVIMGLSLGSWLWLSLLFLMWAFPRSGMHNPAAVLHDWLYWELVRSKIMKRKQADGLFRESLCACRVDRLRTTIMWGCVAIFGGVHIWVTDMGSKKEEGRS